MKNKLVILTLICIIIIIVSGCTSNTTTPTKTPTKKASATKRPTPTILPTITPRPISDTWNSQFAEDTIPSNLDPGKTYTFTIKVFNVGQMPWTFANHTGIYPVIDDSSDNALFYPTESNLTKKVTIKSGQNYTWTLSITAPIQRGNYTIKFRMMNNNTSWFGDTFTKEIMVGNIGDEATFVLSSVMYYKPVTNNTKLSVKANTKQNVSITVNNTGRYSWTGNEMQLAAVDYEQNDAPLFGQTIFYFNPDAIIMPGEKATWKIKLQAPATSGVYYIKYRMKNNGQWFGNTLNVTVTVT